MLSYPTLEPLLRGTLDGEVAVTATNDETSETTTADAHTSLPQAVRVCPLD